MISILKLTFVLLSAAILMTSGCSESSNQAQKLTPPEGIDWAAIEAEDEDMNALQAEGE